MRNRALLKAILAVLAFGISLISFLGLILRDDLTGRLIFGCVWLFVGIWWLGGWLRARRGELSGTRDS